MSAFNSMVAPGSGDPLQEAIARRQGVGGAASNTVSPGSPTYDPSIQPPQVPQGNPMASQPPAGTPPMPQPSLPVPLTSTAAAPPQPMASGNPNTKLILGAMSKYLDHEAQMEASQVGKPYGA